MKPGLYKAAHYSKGHNLAWQPNMGYLNAHPF